MAAIPNSDALTSAVMARCYATAAVLSADIDLLADNATDIGITNQGGFPCREVIVGLGGNLQVQFAGGQTVILYGLPAGRYGLKLRKLLFTGSTAQMITVLW